MQIPLLSRERSSDSEPAGQVKRERQSTSAFTVFNSTSLSERYERMQLICDRFSETKGAVFKVRLPETSEIKALKINLVDPQNAIFEQVNSLCAENERLHVTSTIPIGKIQVKTGPFISAESNTYFVLEPKPNSKKERLAYIYEMELMEGDLSEIKKGLSSMELAAIEVQRIATEAFLYKRGILVEDTKDANVLHRKLTPKDRNADYWVYHIDSETYYIPVKNIRYWIQLCDMDLWRSSENSPPLNFATELQKRLKRSPELLEQLKQFQVYPKGTLLEMTPKNEDRPLKKNCHTRSIEAGGERL